ncbi:cupredoxin domain-containing protein [Candidatus Saccharibacteria bacterium]|nr:cupredoxin domain-containing protein [Candidatus Saccharibacteria bacterium]
MKNRLIMLIVVAVVVGVAAIAKNSSNSSSDMAGMNTSSNKQSNSSEASAEPNTVPIKNIDYTVKKLTIKKGTTVTWRNDDTAQHDVIFDDSSMSEANSPSLLSKGQKHQFTFTKVGTFKYHCTPHPFMQAEIEVID